MTKWRASALLGASAAALVIGLVPFSRGPEREVFSRLAGAPAALTRAALPLAADRPVESLAQEMARALDRVGGIGAGRKRRRPRGRRVRTMARSSTPEPASAQVPFESGFSLGQPDALSQSAPQPQAAPLSPAAQAYRKGDVAALSALAAAAGDPDERLALEWAALRVDPHPSFGALEAFAKAHPTWPGLGYVRYRQEAELLVHPPSPSAVAEFFAARAAAVERGKARRRARGGGDGAHRTRRSGSFASFGATAISTPGPRARSCATSASCC